MTSSCFDFQESFRQSFDMATTVHIYLFPYFLYPALSIAVTGSVYMTVAIAIGEIKVHNQGQLTMKSVRQFYDEEIPTFVANNCLGRTTKYLGPHLSFVTK